MLLTLTAPLSLQPATVHRPQGQHEMAAPRAGSRFTRLAAQPLLSGLHPAGSPASVVRTTLTALNPDPRAGPVALRDMDALCIKVWSKMRPCQEPALEAAERQQELKINVRVCNTKER